MGRERRLEVYFKTKTVRSCWIPWNSGLPHMYNMCTSHSRSLSLSLSVDGEVLRYYGPRPGHIVRRLQRRRRLICRRITCPISASRYVTCYSLSYTKGGCSRGCCRQLNLSEMRGAQYAWCQLEPLEDKDIVHIRKIP